MPEEEENDDESNGTSPMYARRRLHIRANSFEAWAKASDERRLNGALQMGRSSSGPELASQRLLIGEALEFPTFFDSLRL